MCESSSNPVVPVWWRFVVGRRLRVLGLRMRNGRIVTSGDGVYAQSIRRLLVRYRRRELTNRALVSELDVLARRERARSRAARRAAEQRAVDDDARDVINDPLTSARERPGTVGAVSVHPPGGTYEGLQTLHLACATPGAEIRYRLDGDSPDGEVERYQGPVPLTRSCELAAQAFLDGEGGPMTSERFVVRAGPVSASPPGGPHQPPLLVTLRTTTPEAIIHYTLDGTEPDLEAPVACASGVWLRSSATLRACAFVDGWAPGPPFESHYEVSIPQWRVVEPSDRSDAVPHEVKAFLPGQDGRVIAAASLRGRLHADRGAWREDGCALGAVAGWHILAVADGAGSSRLARLGAESACSAARDALERDLRELRPASTGGFDEVPQTVDLIAVRALLTGAVRSAIAEIERIAVARSEDVDAFATTLLVALHRRWGGQDVVASVQVGDGAVCAATSDGVRLLGSGDAGEYAGETRFVTTAGIEQSLDHRVRFLMQARVHLLAVMTDGVADDFFPSEERMPSLLDALLREAEYWPDLEGGLLDWLRYERRGSNDDRTIAILVA